MSAAPTVLGIRTFFFLHTHSLLQEVFSFLIASPVLTLPRRAKKDKYPYGYPGDAFGANSIPYYACHNCQTKFPPNPTEETECPGCQHKKCESCERLRPKKVAPEPDPEVWQSVQAKLAELDLK